MISSPRTLVFGGKWEGSMDRRNVLSLSAITALGLALLSDNALAQQAADVDGEGVGSHALRHIRRPARQDDHCRLGCPKEVLGRYRSTVLAEKRHVVRPAYSRQW